MNRKVLEFGTKISLFYVTVHMTIIIHFTVVGFGWHTMATYMTRNLLHRTP